MNADEGSATLQAAIAMTFVLVALLIAVGAYWHQRATHAAIAAANEGARAARLEDGSEAYGRDVAESFLRQTAPAFLEGTRVEAIRNTATGTATVVIEGRFQLLRGWYLRVHAESSGPIERVTAGGGAG